MSARRVTRRYHHSTTQAFASQPARAASKLKNTFTKPFHITRRENQLGTWRRHSQRRSKSSAGTHTCTHAYINTFLHTGASIYLLLPPRSRLSSRDGKGPPASTAGAEAEWAEWAALLESCWHCLSVLKASSLSQNERKMYSFLDVMMAIAFGMKRAVFSLVMHRMWLRAGGRKEAAEWEGWGEGGRGCRWLRGWTRYL